MNEPSEVVEGEEEKDLLMEQLGQLVEEIASHGERMRDANGEEMTPAAINSELADTVMSLLVDLAEKTHAALVETRDYVNQELAPSVFDLLDAQGDGDGDDEPESMLLPEDSAELTALLLASREALVGGLESVPEEARPALQALTARMERALVRIHDITLEEGDEDELAEAPTEPAAKPNGANEAT
jgi:hypothetical protein